MTQSKLGLAGVVAAVALGVMGNAVPFEREASRSGSNLVIAGDETTPAGAATKGNAEELAKMGKDEGTHTGPNSGRHAGERHEQDRSAGPQKYPEQQL